MTRKEVEWIWDNIRIGLERLNANQLVLHANQQVISYNPDFYNRGSAM